jgi:hypothetical protein
MVMIQAWAIEGGMLGSAHIALVARQVYHGGGGDRHREAELKAEADRSGAGLRRQEGQGWF